METWLHSLFYYVRPDALLSRWSSELWLLIPLPLLFGLEILLSRGRDTTWRAIRDSGRSGRWDFFFALAQVSGLRKILSNFVFFGLVAYLSIVMGNTSLELLRGFPLWLQITGAVLLFDFLYYWNHRIRHTSDWIWQVHEFHHSATRVNLLTSYRVHPLDNLIRVVTIALPFQLLLGLDLQNSLAIVFMASIPGIYAHARIDHDFGWLGRYVFVTPRFHQLHHAVGVKKHANYGNVFVFWDRLFGSYQSPDVPIDQIEQGIEDNFYLRESPLLALWRPVGKFYSYPFRRIAGGIKRISPARKAAR
jgi:sterol desaturase/sphingolipid hydroxylase (fatty acid hydroxylase superfamily)